MDRKEYNACMAKGLKGKTDLSKEERQSLFCVQSKVCSGKAQNEEEAKALCALPKENKKPSQKIAKGQTCEKQAIQVSECMLNKIDFKQAMNPNSFQQEVANAFIECQCQQ